ncbi:MAG: FecR domain-containing protein [Deltaproteobacteria bacterium]|nr:FecR domain-containing protein [Deltaproteobacteria bacterium]
MKKRIVIFGGLVLLLVAVGFYFTRQITAESTSTSQFRKTNTTRTLVAPKVAEPEQINVVDVEGTAEKKSSRGGVWSPMGKGDMLRVDDSVRTRNHSSVILGLGKTSTIELSNASEIEVRELSGAVQRLGLIKGRASVDYGEDGKRVLNIENSDGTVVARVDEGKFSILNNGQLVAVATETGSVDLSAAGESVTVNPGMESVVEKGQAPAKPYSVTPEGYMKTFSSTCKKQNDNMAVVRGTVSTGTTVLVNGTETKTNPDGTFFTHVRVPEGSRRVELKTTDIWGKEREQMLMCNEPKPTAKIDNIDIIWGNKGEGG